MSLMSRLGRGRPSGAAPAPSLGFSAVSLLGAAVAIGLLGGLTQWSGAPWLMAPFGASCVLVFGLPDSPLAQPRSVLGGHVLSTLVGLLVLHSLGGSWWAQGLAVGLALAVMQQTRTVHAPAGANPLVVLALQPGWDFVLLPVLAGAVVVVALAWGVNNTRAQGSYPRYWR